MGGTLCFYLPPKSTKNLKGCGIRGYSLTAVFSHGCIFRIDIGNSLSNEYSTANSALQANVFGLLLFLRYFRIF